MKRYAITGELIPDENGFLIEYSTMLKILKMAQSRNTEEVSELQSSIHYLKQEIDNNYRSSVFLQEQIDKWKTLTYWAVGAAVIFLII